MASLSLLLIWTCVLYVATGQAFTPGCSFSSGQCLYNVKLGHEGQCDSVKRASTDPNQGVTQGCSCHDIDATKADVRSLTAGMATMQQNFDVLAKQLNVTQEQLGLKDVELSRLQLQNTNLTAMLSDRESLLQKSKVELANTVASMNIELTRLRGALATTSDKLTTCETNLQVVDPHAAQHSNNPALIGSYTTSYCGFERSDYCGYTVSPCTSSTVECWNRGSGRQNTNSGPVEDHTYGTPQGHYLYVDPYKKPSYGNHGLRLAQLTSPEFPPAHAYCVRLWYTLHGADVTTLKVYAKVGSGNGYPVYQKSGEAGPNWQMAQISLDAEYTSSPFRLVVEGSTNSYYANVYTSSSHYSHKVNYHENGYMAIDDIFVYNTTCSSIPACPDMTHRHHDLEQNTTSCYMFNATASTWYDAVKTCKQAAPSGHLVSVTSKKEQDFLVDTIRTNTALNTAGQYGWYTSGNDERVEGHFVWTDTGYPYAVNYTDWHIGQPNNVGNAQQCLLLEYPDTSYEWGDVNCNDKHPFICEIHL